MRLAALFFTAAVSALASAPVVDPDTIPQSQKPPHPVHVLFYVSDLTTDEQAGAVRQAVGALKTVKDVTVNLDRDYVAVSFDQRDLSFHQIAAAIGESYDPRVLMYVPDYANPQLRPKIQAVFDRPNLTALVRVQPLDAQQGRFFVHFLRLASGIGFNGGSFTHPIHLPPPLGLGLTLKYASRDDTEVLSAAHEIRLWNGRNFDGWDFVTAPSPPVAPEKVFRIEPDGVLAAQAKITAYLATAQPYHDYAFHAEWRWTTRNPHNNSGFFIHIVGGPKDRHWPVCFQVQNKPGHAGDLIPMAGAKFAELPADAIQLDRRGPESENPNGQWNCCDVTCRGDTLEARINGRLQCTATRLVPQEGRIGIQLEGFPFEIRNVTLIPLDR